MRETLNISLPAKTKRLVERAADSGLTTSEYVRIAILGKLWQDAAAESRRVAVPRPDEGRVYRRGRVPVDFVRVVFDAKVYRGAVILSPRQLFLERFRRGN
jgi:hypothetical protein